MLGALPRKAAPRAGAGGLSGGAGRCCRAPQLQQVVGGRDVAGIDDEDPGGSATPAARSSLRAALTIARLRAQSQHLTEQAGQCILVALANARDSRVIGP
jgi:hypothetical protein